MLIKSEGLNLSYGFIVFWSIEKGDHFTPELVRQAALDCDIPDVMDDFDAVDVLSAFEKVGNLSGKGAIPGTYVADLDPAGSTILWTTRKVSTNEFLMIREVFDPFQKKMVEHSQDVGSLLLNVDKGTVSFGFKQLEPLPQFTKDIDSVVAVVEMLIEERTTTIDPDKIRKNLLNWVKANHKVALRGNGGLYFIPNGNDPAIRSRILGEIKSIQCFLQQIAGGAIMSLEVIATEGFNPDQYVNEATAELSDEFTALEELIDAATSKKGGTINARTRTRIDLELARLRDKVLAIDDTFETKLIHLHTRYEMAEKFSQKIDYVA